MPSGFDASALEQKAMRQQTLAMATDQVAGFERHCKPTGHDAFLKKMDGLVPSAALCTVVALSRTTQNAATGDR